MTVLRADGSPVTYDLVFADEFDGSVLDRSKWCTRYMNSGGAPLQAGYTDSTCTMNGWLGTTDYFGTLDRFESSNEQQRYVDVNTAAQVMHPVSGSVLSLRATQTRTNTRGEGAPYPDIYESAMIRSKALWRPQGNTAYYITSRFRLPNVLGTWPAFWLDSALSPVDGSQPWPPEIDIMEGGLTGGVGSGGTGADCIHISAKRGGRSRGDNNAPSILYSAPTYEQVWCNYYSPDGTSFRNRWLQLGLLWTAETTTYFVDSARVLSERYRWEQDNRTPVSPAYIVLNLAIGGWAGANGFGAFPCSFDIDHVRVYQGAVSDATRRALAGLDNIF